MSFPTKDNPQLCRNGCGKKIYLDNFTGKYLPYNVEDDSQHDCRKNGNGNGKQKQEFTLEAVQKKLESIGIIINIERLMNEK
jgi:hypothetical protein